MADELGLGITREMIFGGLDTITMAVITLLIIAIIITVIWFIWFRKQFKHSITLRKRTKGETDRIIFDKYRYRKVKGEAESIQLWSNKALKPLPPEAAKDFIEKNGREYVEAWELETGELRFIFADNKSYNIDGEDLTRFNIIKTEDKEFYANVVEKAVRFKNKDLLQWLQENASIIALVMIVILIVGFWSDIAKSTSAVAQSNAAVSSANAILIDRVDALLQDREYIMYLNASGKLGEWKKGAAIVPD